jgi:hypothetical protein
MIHERKEKWGRKKKLHYSGIQEIKMNIQKQKVQTVRTCP